MENVFLTSLTTPEVRQLFREELETYFGNHDPNNSISAKDEQPVTQQEICRFLNISLPTLIRWKKKRVIPYLEVGSRQLFLKSKVILAIENNKKGSKNGKQSK
jgi:excisionase family DNA binding protein